MTEFAKQKGLEYNYQLCEDEYIRFYLTNPKWNGKYWIGFTADSNGYYYGLCNNPNKYNLSAETRVLLQTKLKELGVNPRKESQWWPFYSFIPTLNIENWQNDIINSENFINDCKDKINTILLAIEGISL